MECGIPNEVQHFGKRDTLKPQGGKRARTESLLRVSRNLLEIYIIYIYKYIYRCNLTKESIINEYLQKS